MVPEEDNTEEELPHATLDDLMEEKEIVGGGEGKMEPLMILNVEVGNGIHTKAIVDTGATISCIDLDMYEKLVDQHQLEGELLVTGVNLMTAVNNRKVKVNRQVMFDVVINNKKYKTLAFVVQNLFVSIVLGLNWLKEYQALINCKEWTLNIGGMNVIQMGKTEEGIEETTSTESQGDQKISFKTEEAEEKNVQVGLIGSSQMLDDRWKRIIEEMSEEGFNKVGKKQYRLCQGRLFMEKPDARNGWVLCIPKQEIQAVLKQYHEGNLHPGISRMQRMMKNLVTWKGMMEDVKKYVKCCHVCQINKPKTHRFVGVLQHIIPRKP